jgi:hypothetical protein
MIHRLHRSISLAPLALLVSLAACRAPRPESARDDVRRFFEAAQRGDLVEQMQVLVAADERTERGRLVVQELFPDEQMRWFTADSAVLDEVKGDTAVWIVWGRHPNWERYDWEGAVRRAGSTFEVPDPTPAEIQALPRITGAREVRLVRTREGWKLWLQADHAGLLLARWDTLHARCPLEYDPRPCRPVAERMVRDLPALSPWYMERYGHLANDGRAMVLAAQAMDSVRLELRGERTHDYSPYNSVDVTVLNASAVPLEDVVFRVLDADGRLINPAAVVNLVPARGRKEGTVQVLRGGEPRPLRLELASTRVEWDPAGNKL